MTASSATIAAVQAIDQHGVYISEVSASFAPRSDGKDWIELYNGGGEAVSLEGWHLGTDIDAPDACPLSGTIEPGGYRVFYASNNVAKQDAQTLGLGIAQSGEQIVLSNGYGEVADLFETGALKLGYTSGRVEGGKGERAFFDTPTLGEKNASPVDRQLNAPEFSLPGGYYAGQQALAITAEEGCSIYYTLDGSTPTAQSAPYTQPLALTETTVVKAIAAKDGYIVSDPAVATYLFVEPHVIPVVSLTMDEADFRAICASTTKENIVERACNVEYYENDGTLGTSFPAGIRISGNSTRNYPQKSFSLYLRSGYGKSSVVYPFFENYELTQYNTLLLRNAGQNISYARMMDAYASALFSDMRMDSAKSKFVVVYVNGRYYGILDLKENLNEDGLAYKNDVDVQEVTVIRRNIHALSGSNAQVKQVYDYAKSWNMADDVQYEKFCEFVDADAWIDYIIARSYTGDYDIFNQKLWNTSSYSVKWRPIFYDCDFAFAGLSACTLDKYFTYDGVPSQDGSFTNMYIPTALKKNSGWRDAFVKRYAEVMVDLPARSLALFDEMYGQLSAEMERHIARWGKPSSYEQWNRYAQNLRYILEKRPQVVINQVERVFQVPQEQMRELFPDYE